jgi:hypothetical protein
MTRARQAQVAASVGRAFVQRAEIESALARQAAVLLDAAAGIRDAMRLAEQAAQAARTGGNADIRQYEHTVSGLQSQLAVVEQARGHLRTAQAAAEANIDSAHAMLRQNVASLDRVLRDEVRLLTRLERLERERVIGEARRRRASGRGGDGPRT